jgi:hypothetical protein
LLGVALWMAGVEFFVRVFCRLAVDSVTVARMRVFRPPEPAVTSQPEDGLSRAPSCAPPNASAGAHARTLDPESSRCPPWRIGPSRPQTGLQGIVPPRDGLIGRIGASARAGQWAVHAPVRHLLQGPLSRDAVEPAITGLSAIRRERIAGFGALGEIEALGPAGRFGYRVLNRAAPYRALRAQPPDAPTSASRRAGRGKCARSRTELTLV